MSVTRKWSLLAGVLALAILAAGWFLLVSPKRSEAAGLREQVTSQEGANSRLLQQLEVLKAQQAELPQQRARLAVMRTQIPDNPALPTLIRDLTAAGRKVGVSIDSLAPEVPVALVAAQPVVPAATTSESSETTGAAESGTSSDTSGASDTGAPATQPPPAPSLYQVPLALTVTGSYFELEQFVNKLEGLKRSFLVSGFTVAPADEAGTESVAASPGDLTLALQGRVFLSPPAPAATATQPIAAPAAPAQ